MKRINIFLNGKGKEKKLFPAMKEKCCWPLVFTYLGHILETTVREICIVQGS